MTTNQDYRTCSSALKEWAVAIDSLGAGESTVIIRKGGIREHRNQFQVLHPSFLLSATYEHQQYQLLKRQATKIDVDRPKEWSDPNSLRFDHFATVDSAFLVSDPSSLTLLSPFHIWSDSYAEQRLRWRPAQPLTVMILRVYALSRTRSAPMLPAYKGCKSWLELQDPIELGELKPALSDEVFASTAQGIRDVLSQCGFEPQNGMTT